MDKTHEAVVNILQTRMTRLTMDELDDLVIKQLRQPTSLLPWLFWEMPMYLADARLAGKWVICAVPIATASGYSASKSWLEPDVRHD